ncbi:elongation factor 4 [Candidatus Collierbacteria bacterium]|nr:elongation factor 4 [Candidatus Collierbacteria bacterium]
MTSINIRNFAIIAHVDHGKSTLSDRLMEFTGTVEKRQMREQILDSNPIERERGVTISLAPVTMKWKNKTIEDRRLNIVVEDRKSKIENRLPSILHPQPPSSTFNHLSSYFILNLIDTPGHVDFAYEVDRSLAACEGAILLIDATQGIQAQTLAHAQRALAQKLYLIPVINKIDLSNANVPEVLTELNNAFGFKENEVSLISAKTGQGVENLIQRIITELPAPKGNQNLPLRGLIFNSTYDQHLGVIAFVRIVDGELAASEKLSLMAFRQNFLPKEIGIFTPKRTQIDRLETGQVGYIATGLKDIRKVKAGDTITVFPILNSLVPLSGYREPKPSLYADLYPDEGEDFKRFLEGFEKLKLSDASLSSRQIFSQVLGPGLQCGFLGLFHLEITRERLEKEFGLPTIMTLPTVEYSAQTTDGQTLTIKNANDFPDPSRIVQVKEPMTKTMIFTPQEYLGSLMQIAESRRGKYLNTNFVGNRAQLTYIIPLAELVSGMFDEVKSASRGFATMDYDIIGLEPVEAVKLTILLNHEPAESLSRIIVKSKTTQIGKQMVEKLKELMPSQQFAVPIQAAIGAEIIARETKPALRKDVTAKLYGGDQTRKDKLLKKQKKGKKRLAQFGRVRLPSEILSHLLTG